jgi:hypothetical protein
LFIFRVDSRTISLIPYNGSTRWDLRWHILVFG